MALDSKKLRRLYESAVKDELKEKPNVKPRGEAFFTELKEGFEKGEVRPEDFSIRGLMEEFIVDESGRPCGYEIVNSWNPQNGGDAKQISLTQLVEGGSVQVSNFSNITGQIVYNKTLESYKNEDFTFTQTIPTVPTQFNGERIAGIGGIGDETEVVPEAGQYPMVGVSEDWIDTPSTVKRGLILPLTKEAAFFDRTGLILKRCAEVGEFLGINKELRAVDCVIDENTTAHRYNRKGRGAVATYGDNSGNHDWDNLQATNGLTNWTNVDNIDQLLYTILDPNTGLPIIITGKMRLIVGRGLLRTAEQIQRSTSLQIMNPGYATSGNPSKMVTENNVPSYEILTSRYLAYRQATTTSYYYGAPDQAFCYMENFPMTVVEAPANSEMEFNQDIVMRWKASERGQFATVDPRKIAKATA